MKRKTLLISTLLLFTTISQTSCKNSTQDSINTKCTITFSLNGGTMPSYQNSLIKEVDANQAIGTLPVPTKENSIFLGWFLGNEVNDGQLTSISTISKDITVYARYKDDEESISVNYDNVVNLDTINEIKVTLKDDIKSQGFSYTIDNKDNIVIVSKTDTSLIYKTIKTGEINVKISSVSNPSKFRNIKINIAESSSLVKTIENISNLTSYTYTGFTIENGVEKVESILRVTSNSITQLDSNNKAVYKSDSIPRYGIATNVYKDVYYIDSSSENDNNSFKSSPSLVKTDSGFLNEKNFTGNPVNSLNDSGDIFGFKALSSSWFTSLSSVNNTYEIDGNSSTYDGAQLSMIEAGLVKMTSPYLYDVTSKYAPNSQTFPYLEIASRIDTKLYLISNDSIFVELKFENKSYYGRISNINKTTQAYDISRYISEKNSTSIGKPDYKTDTALKDMNSLITGGGIRTESVTLNNSASSGSMTFPVYTFLNPNYIFTYYSDDYIEYEKQGVKNPRYIIDNEETPVGYVKKTNSNPIYPFTFKLYDDDGHKKEPNRTASDISISSTFISSDSIASNFPIVDSNKVFYKSDLMYTFNTTMSLEGLTYNISYSDDVYNQIALFDKHEDDALRRITAIRPVYNVQNQITGFKAKIGHLTNGRDITWDRDYTYSNIGNGIISNTSGPIIIADADNIHSALTTRFN